MVLPRPSIQVLEAAQALGYAARCLLPLEAEQRWQCIIQNFTDSSVGVLWHHLKGAVAVHRTDGWAALDEYLVRVPFVLFFDRAQDAAMIEFPDGAALSRILEQCIGFEFYLADQRSTYVVCFNDHNCLIAAGEATKWKLFACSAD